MKGIKKLSIITLGLAFAFGLAACNNGGGDGSSTNTNSNVPTTTEGGGGGDTSTTTPEVDDGYFHDQDQVIEYNNKKEQEDIPSYIELSEMDLGIGDISALDNPGNYPDVYVNPQNKLQYQLDTITAYTNDARTTFYLGEEFSSDGLLVLATFIKLDENGSPLKEDGKTISVRAKVDTFYVDSSTVDTSVMGSYSVKVSYRYCAEVKTFNYTITVRSSEFETTKNLKYVAGLKVGYKADKLTTKLDNTSIYKSLQNDGRIYTRYVNYNDDKGAFENDFSLDIDQLDINVVSNEVNGVASAFKQTVRPYDPSKLTNDKTNKKITSEDGKLVIDYSQVDTGKAGSYRIKVTYTATGFIINGEKRDNIVQAFIVVDVINPIAGMKLTDSSTKNVMASLDGKIDLSDYNIKIYRKFGPTETLAITEENFDISGAISYIKGEQNALITAKELSDSGETYTATVKLNITESDKYDIDIISNVAANWNLPSTGLENQPGVVEFKKASGDFDCLGYEEKAINSYITAHHVGISDSNKKSLVEKSATCSDDSLSLSGYCRLDSVDKGSYIEIKVDKPATIIVYLAPNADGERGFAVYDASNTEIYLDTTGYTKQAPRKFVIELDAAGTYKLAASTSGQTIQFYGCIVATTK